MAGHGVWVALLGPDGSGKSSVLEEVERLLAPHFRGVKRYHLRPHWGRLRPTDAPVTDPHARPARPALLSLAKLGLWWADYGVGYAALIRPRLARDILVTFDRYYHDLLVDPQRYRYGGPLRLAALGARWLPRPHVIIVLDAPPEVLRQRKREVTLEETTRQREAYRRLAVTLPNARLVNAAQPLAAVAAEVASIVRSCRDAPRRAGAAR
ncbi:MAG: hypothetical protein ABR559_01585 [Gemmatimonadota bacterium]